MIKTMLNDGCIIILNPMTNNPMTDKTYLTHFIPWSNLVGGLEHFLFFHILGIIIPTDKLVFFRGVGQPPTSIPWSNDGMFIFNSYLTFAQRVNLHFPMLFLCFSYGFPMVFLWILWSNDDQMTGETSHRTPRSSSRCFWLGSATWLGTLVSKMVV
jgi:hypothetical protein